MEHVRDAETMAKGKGRGMGCKAKIQIKCTAKLDEVDKGSPKLTNGLRRSRAVD